MLVTKVGMVMIASASSSGTASVMSPTAIGGSPMPTAPLAMPAKMKAMKITRI